MSRYPHQIFTTTGSIQIIQFQSGPMQNFQYCVVDPVSKTMAVIDPAWSIEPMIHFSTLFGCRITQVWITHGHFDHVNQLNNLVNAISDTPQVVLFSKPLFTPETSNTLAVTEGSTITFGDTQWDILHTPGHSPDSICFKYDTHLICGDLLFVNACGRSDLPGSNPLQMQQSMGRIGTLSGETRIYPGHDYGPTSTDTIQNQLMTNPHLILAHRSHNSITQ
jgi:hydroxyacylglutathione hydrolase